MHRHYSIRCFEHTVSVLSNAVTLFTILLRTSTTTRYESLVVGVVTDNFQEEDFASQLFNRELLHTFPPEDVVDLMIRVEKDLHEASDKSGSKDVLSDRLGFRITLLSILIRCLDAVELDDPLIVDYLRFISKIEASEPSAAGVIEKAFSIKIQRRLASSVPPRPMVVIDRKESFAFLRQLGTDIESAFGMFSIWYSCDLYTAFWLFNAKTPAPSVYVRALLQSFMSIKDLVFGKVVPDRLMTEDLKMLTMPASVLLDPAHYAVENPVDNRFRVFKEINQFIYKVSPLMVNHCRSLCQNRCRLRRLLGHSIVELDTVQADAEDLDGLMQTLIHETAIPYPADDEPTYAFPVSSWVYHYKLTQLQLIVQMGFEQTVYAHHEYAGMYWYLSNLASLHLSHLERISYFVSSETHQRATGLDRSTQTQELQDAMSHLYRTFSRAKAIDTLASALHRLYVFLQRHGHYSKVNPAYSSDELRFDLRMRPFQSLSIPEPLTSIEMEELSSMDGVPDKVVLEQASTLALTSRKAWEEILKKPWNVRPLGTSSNNQNGNISLIDNEYQKDIRNCMRAAIGTSIAVTTISKAMNEAGNKKRVSDVLKQLKITIPSPEDPDRFHACWAVPKVTR
jgi:N-alpha-acetyltransferase 35, NatC auxiliary subunit